MKALLLLLSVLGSAAFANELPRTYTLLERPGDGVPLLQYEPAKKGGRILFIMEPKFGTEGAAMAAMHSISAEVNLLGLGPDLVGPANCKVKSSHRLFCEVTVTEKGEKILLKILNLGLAPFFVQVQMTPVNPIDGFPEGQTFAVSAQVKHSYFLLKPIKWN